MDICIDLLNRRIHPVYILIHTIDVPKNHCRSIQNDDWNWSICFWIVHRSASFITEKLYWIPKIRKFGKWYNIICFHWFLSIYVTMVETRKTWTVVGKMFITNCLNIQFKLIEYWKIKQENNCTSFEEQFWLFLFVRELKLIKWISIEL
jgi:hypothetical protein